MVGTGPRNHSRQFSKLLTSAKSTITTFLPLFTTLKLSTNKPTSGYFNGKWSGQVPGIIPDSSQNCWRQQNPQLPLFYHFLPHWSFPQISQLLDIVEDFSLNQCVWKINTGKSVWKNRYAYTRSFLKDFWRFLVPLGALSLCGWQTFPNFSTCPLFTTFYRLSCLSNIFSCEHH